MSDLIGKYPVVLRQDLVWGDMDAFQHINNTVYFRYFENARIAYFKKIGVIEYMQAHRIGPILASTRCDFKAPLTYPGSIQIAASIKDIRAKRFTMAYVVYSENLASIAASGEGLIVYYNYKKFKSCPIPEKIVNEIKRIETGFAQA